MTRNRQRWVLPPLGAQAPACRIFRISSSGTGSGFKRRIARIVCMISNSSVSPGIGPPFFRQLVADESYSDPEACARRRNVARSPRAPRSIGEIHDEGEAHDEEEPMTTVGSGSYQYEVMETWAKLPAGWTFGPVSAVATDSRDRVYAFQRKDPPIIVFDRDGSYLSSWDRSAIKDPPGIAIVADVIYLTSRDDHVHCKFLLVAMPLLVPGPPG